MALDELQRKCFGENWSHVGQAHVHLKGKKIRASFQHKNPCNLQAMMLKPLDFPRENSRIFEMKVNSFAMAKTTFFQKRSKRWRGFPPDGMFLMMILQQSVFNVPHPVNTRSLVVSQNRQQTNLRS